METDKKLQRPHNVVLDMDGVVLDSEATKIAAFASLFAEYPNYLEEIDRYNRSHRGIPVLKNSLMY